jgi:hypothetical protein
VRLLHLSDLHVTWSEESLETLWASVRRCVGDIPFDAIVISGDLTQSAAAPDYSELINFIEARLLKAVRDGDRTRIIAIPGNHDVDWKAKIGDYHPVFELGPDKAALAFSGALQNGDSEYRLVHSGYGHFELLKVENPHEQFRSVQQAFFDKLHPREPEPSGHLAKAMDLLREGDDWSAHLFPHDKIAIFGFNSCHKNDRFWHGARINPASVAKAEEFARRHASGSLWCAVWHHGISSVGHRVDHLPLSDISRMANAGFRVGFHGHIHESVTQVFQGRFTHDITLIATGSLGAGTQDRPDAVGNQFSTIFLSETEIHGTIFEWRPPHDFEIKERHHERLRDLIPRRLLDPSITSHKRTYSTDAEGFTMVDIELNKVTPFWQTQDNALTIAQLRPPVCSTRSDSPGVTETRLPNGEIRYSTSLSQIRSEGSTFTYRASNMLALSQVDLRCRNDQPSLTMQSWEQRSHHVRFPCQELVLDFKFATAVLSNGAEATVSWVDETGASHTIDEEAARCRFEHLDDTHVRLTVPTPQVGARYGLRYMPPEEQDGHGHQNLEAFCRRLIKVGRQRPLDDGHKGIPIIRNINTTMIPAIKEHLKLESDSLAWMLLVWNPNIRHLVPVFGEFEAAKWGLRFEHGSGVAGHALRFRRIARWHKDRSSHSLVYLRQPSGQEIEDRHVWLLCIPILLSRAGPRVGVLTLESNEGEDPRLERLETFARSQHDDAETSHRLLYASNITFWTSCLEACRENPEQTLSANDQILVEQAVHAWTEDSGAIP